MKLWLILILGGMITFAMRLSFIYLLGRVDVPDAVQRALRFVPAAVLSALVAPELLMPAGKLDFGPDNHRWLAGLVAVLVAWRTRNTLFTIIAGMLALLLLELWR